MSIIYIYTYIYLSTALKLIQQTNFFEINYKYFGYAGVTTPKEINSKNRH